MLLKPHDCNSIDSQFPLSNSRSYRSSLPILSITPPRRRLPCANAVTTKPPTCTADELHYVSVPGLWLTGLCLMVKKSDVCFVRFSLESISVTTPQNWSVTPAWCAGIRTRSRKKALRFRLRGRGSSVTASTFINLSTNFYTRVYDDEEEWFRSIFANSNKEGAFQNQYEFFVQMMGEPPLFPQRREK